MRWLIVTLLLAPICAFSKQVVVTITPDYELTSTNTQIICASLHANLSTEALLKLDTLEHFAYLCQMTQDADGTKHLVLTLTLK